MFRVFITFLFLFPVLMARAQTCDIVSADFVCKEELMSFDVTASAGIQSVSWEMGDATTSTQQKFNHKYSTKGVKNVKVTISLTGGGTCVATKKVTVYEQPQFKIIEKPGNIYCLLQNKVCLVDSSTGGDSAVGIKKRIIIWDDGNQSVATNPKIGETICHNYTKSGKFKVTIELTNDKDCKSKMEIDITILNDVIPKIWVYSADNNSLGYCDSARTEFTDLTNNDTNEVINRIYDWGDGTKTTTKSRAMSHFYKKSGFYRVSLSFVQKNGCVTPKDTVIEVVVYEVKFNITRNATKQCQGENFRFSQLDPYQGAYYRWFMNDTAYIWDWDLKTIDASPGLGIKKFSLNIYNNGCVKLSGYDTIEIIGFNIKSIVLNDNQCINKDTVYFRIKTVSYGIGRLSYFIDYGDNLAPQCTTSRTKGINVNSNCNYTTDSLGTHFYVNPLCRPWNAIVKDVDFGCSDMMTGGYVNAQMPPKTQYDFKYTADRKCLGDKVDYVIRFHHSLCGPGLKVNLDSACGKKLFAKSFITEWPYKVTCNKDGWITVGFALRFGSPIIYKSFSDTSNYDVDLNRVCDDTVWYHHWFRLFPDPISDFTAIGGCLPAAVKPVFVLPVQKDIAYHIWDWGDDTKIDTVLHAAGDTILKAPTHIYKKPGKFSIKHYLQNQGRCYKSDTTLIGLGFTVKMSFDTVICPGSLVRLLDTIYYGVDTSKRYWTYPDRKLKGLETFKWDFDDGRGFVTDTSRPVISFPKTGIYKVRLAAKDSMNCRDTLTRFVNVGSVHAGIKAINKRLICDDIIQFFDSSHSDYPPPADSISRYSWEFGDNGNPSYVKNPFHFYKTFGEFTVVHRVENSRGCVDSTSIKIRIEGPVARFDIVGDSIGCAPFTAEFRNLSLKTRDFIWFFGDPLKSKLSTNRDTNVRFTYDQPGIYYIYLFGSDSVINPNAGNAIYYCKSLFPDTTLMIHPVRKIIVLPSPKADFTVDSIQCKGKPFLVTDRSDSIYDRYKWEILPHVDILETTNKSGFLSASDTGTFTIRYTPSYPPSGQYNRSCPDTVDRKVKITEVAADFIIIKDTTSCPVFTFINDTRGYSSFSWDLGDAAAGADSNIRTENQVTHVYASSKGKFYPCLFAENKDGCRDTVCKEIDVNFVTRLIMPNVFTPNNDGLNDVFDIDAEGVDLYNLTVFNRWGQVIFRTTEDGRGADGKNWDGKAKGSSKLCPDGTYFYIFQYKFKCNDVIYKANGTITLIAGQD